MEYEDVTDEMRTYAKPCVLGLGYGGAEAALISVAAGYGVVLTRKEAKVDVNFYRKQQYPLVPKLWYAVFNMAKKAIDTREPLVFNDGSPTRLEFRCAGGYLFILLPSGRRLSYPQVEINSTWIITVKKRPIQMEAAISYMGLKDNIWMRIGIHPGRMIENIVSGLARDILCYGALCADQGGYPIIATVHDEALTEVDDTDDYTLAEFGGLMCILQEWSKTIPVSFNGYEGYRFKKD